MARQFTGIARQFIDAIKTQFIGMGAKANDIIVQDLYSYNPTNQQNSTYLRDNQSNVGILDELTTSNPEDRNIISSILSVYDEHISTKREILTQARNLFDTSDIIQTLVDVMIDDGFNSFQNENEEFKIKYELDEDDLENLGEEYQQQVQNEIDDFVDKFDIKQRAADIVPELIRDGEYAWGVVFDPNCQKGVLEIVDELDVINLLPFYEGEKLAFVINQNNLDYVGQNKKSNKAFMASQLDVDTRAIAYKPDNVVFFRLDGLTKKRINMSNFYNEEFKKLFYKRTHIKLPKFVRIALPMYWSAMKNLNRLKIMENVSTVLDLQDILKPEIVHVTVPTNTSPVQAQQIIRNYERQLNETSGLGAEDSYDLSTLAAQANRRKVLPQWIDTKGTLQSAAVNQSAKGQGAWDSVDKLRNQIALNIGIPPFYINVSQTPIDKAQTIKLYSRYTRKLTALQKTLSDGLKDLILLHLKYKGINISKHNLTIKFKAITSGDSLDDTDLLVGLVTGISDLYKALDEITASDHNNLVLDDEQFKELFDDMTGKYLNIANLIRVDEDKFENMDGEEEGFEPIGSPGDHSHGPVTGPSTNIEISGPGEDTSYQDFVADSNDIGVPGTEPAIEEI